MPHPSSPSPHAAIAAIIISPDPAAAAGLCAALRSCGLVHKIILLATAPYTAQDVICIVGPHPEGGRMLQQALQHALECPQIMIFTAVHADCTPGDIAGLASAARETQAAICYADYYEAARLPQSVRPVCAYQPGSIRDDFDFGPVLCFDSRSVQRALGNFGGLADTRWAGLYELRLKTSGAGPVLKINTPLCCVPRLPGSSPFGYVDPRRIEYQREMEHVATAHLRRIGALCTHELLPAPDDPASRPVVATVVIPVKNRERTISDALRSALRQRTPFPFNVIVVDNHSTDGTGAAVAAIAAADPRVVRIVPERTDLGIGGCWNLAVQSPRCGRYVCQLDSDDLYADEHTLAAMIGMVRDGGFGMVVGSYRVVDFSLREIPPGVVDHREWNDLNGRNNLLRVAGIGAPRAFATVLLRQFPFPNVSYGEDYAVALRIARDYRVGRVYEPLYLCRRWEDNTDARLSPDQAVRYATYKDSLRTREIEERQRRVRQMPATDPSP